MISLWKALTSSIGQKFLMALSGLGMVGFTVTHLAGNLLLYKKDAAIFNAYAEKLESFGVLLEMAEIGLIGIFALHIATAIGLTIQNRAARGGSYSKWKSKGHNSRANSSSRYMIVTGMILLAFIVMHIWQFKFGGGATTEEMKHNLYQIVYTTFKNPLFVVIYVVCMIMLGMHLRHGFWSAFQSLGAMNAKFEKPMTCLGYIVAGVLAVGFLGIPIWIFLDGGMS